jgi:hypothetical protein
MPISYVIDEDRRVIRMRGWGRMTNEEMVDCIGRLRADSRVKPGMPTLSDMREVTDMAIDIEGITATSQIMADSRDARGPARIAIVVKNMPDAMMAKLLSRVSEPSNPLTEIRPFESYEEAEAWLGL